MAPDERLAYVVPAKNPPRTRSDQAASDNRLQSNLIARRPLLTSSQPRAEKVIAAPGCSAWLQQRPLIRDRLRFDRVAIRVSNRGEAEANGDNEYRCSDHRID